MNGAKLGVFICDCGDQISSCLDLDCVQDQISDLPGVICARRLRFGCSTDGLAAIQDAILKQGLKRILVAGCTPRTMEPLFRESCEAVGLSGDLFELVDIREGCAWVHLTDPEAATSKAADLIRMGISRVGLRDARSELTVDIEPTALVIGGGLAGMSSAMSLANAGVSVKLIEREAILGGMLRAVHSLFPERQEASEYLREKIEAVTCHPHIEVLLQKQVSDISGTVGRFSIVVNGTNGDHNSSASFDVGAIIVATGAREAKPYGLYRYDGERVITQLEFESEFRTDATKSEGLPDSVVMILCAGQCNGHIPYCSGVCCMTALKQAVELKSSKPGAEVTILFRDLYLLGDDAFENELIKARQERVRFMRFGASQPPEVTGEVVVVQDELTGVSHRLPYDRVVLAVPLIPQEDAGAVAHLLKIHQDTDGFFPETRHRLKPGNCPERGIYVCGAAHHPVDRATTEFQAARAAFKALSHLSKRTVTRKINNVEVDEQLCTGCGNCVDTCPFNAISMRNQPGLLDLSEIDPLLCVGCGNCVVACPVKAIFPAEDSDAQILGQIDEALKTSSDDVRPRILAFGCEWSGFAAAELAGARKITLPVEVRLIRVGCSARFDPLHVLWAFHNGADGVFLGACPPGSCHYGSGNLYAQERITRLYQQLKESGFDHRRLQFVWVKPDDPHGYVKKMWSFTNLIRQLGTKEAGVH